jgi:hypothetical protein
VPAPDARRRRGLLSLIAALLAGIALLGGLAWALSQVPLGHNTLGAARSVEVPDVVGLTREEARSRLEGSGLELGSQVMAPSDQAAASVVVEQNPPAGTEAERGTAVNLVISTGPAVEATTSASPSATPSASPSASPSATSTPSAAPGGGQEPQQPAEEAQKRREEPVNKPEEAADQAPKKPPSGGPDEGKKPSKSSPGKGKKGK